GGHHYQLLAALDVDDVDAVFLPPSQLGKRLSYVLSLGRNIEFHNVRIPWNKGRLQLLPTPVHVGGGRMISVRRGFARIQVGKESALQAFVEKLEPLAKDDENTNDNGHRNKRGSLRRKVSKNPEGDQHHPYNNSTDLDEKQRTATVS